LRNAEGKNSFALLEEDVKIGRAHAAYHDTKFISQEAEWFLAGVLDGLAEGAYLASHDSILIKPAINPSDANGQWSKFPIQ
jgi:hypothetical protein